MNLDPFAEEFAPKYSDLFALRNTVGRNESARNPRVLDVLGRLEVPERDVIEQAAARHSPGDELQVGPLLVGLILAPDKRRIAQNVAAFAHRENLVPVDSQSIRMADGRRLREGQTRSGFPHRLAEGDVHLVIDEPHCGLSDLGREFVDLDPVERGDLHFGQRGDVKCARTGSGVERREHFDFELPEFAVSDDEEVPASASRVQELERRQLVVVGFESGFARFDLFDFVPQFVEKQGAD